MFSYDKKANLNNRTELQGFQFFKTPILRLDLQSCGRRSVPQICFALYLTETTTSSFLQIFPQLFVWYANSRLQVTNLLSTWRTDFCKVLKIATFQNRIFRLLTSRTQNKAYAQSNILSVKFFFFFSFTMVTFCHPISQEIDHVILWSTGNTSISCPMKTTKNVSCSHHKSFYNKPHQNLWYQSKLPSLVPLNLGKQHVRFLSSNVIITMVRLRLTAVEMMNSTLWR